MMAVQPSGADIKNMDEISSEFVGWFTKLLRPTNRVLEKYVNIGSKREDEVQQMENILFLLKSNQDLSRWLYQPFMFLKQHRGLLAHYKGCKSNDVKKALVYLGDIIVCLRLMKEDERLIEDYISFYESYFKVAKICVPFTKSVKRENFREKEEVAMDAVVQPSMKISEDFIPPEIITFDPIQLKETDEKQTIHREIMPQGKTIKWYKKNGYGDEFKTKLVTPVDVDGLYGHYFRVERYNGNNTMMVLYEEDPKTILDHRGERLIVNDKGYKYFSSYVTFEWKS